MRHHLHERPSDDHSGDHVVVLDLEAIVEHKPTDGGFPKWPKHKVIVASFLTASITDEGHTFSMTSIVCEPGGEQAFYKRVNEMMPLGVTSISANGKGYDLPLLQLGAAGARSFDLEGLSEHARAKRFDRPHCDLLEMWSAYRKDLRGFRYRGPSGVRVAAIASHLAMAP